MRSWRARPPEPRPTELLPSKSAGVSCALCWAFRIIVVDSLSDKNPLVKQIRRAVSRGTLTEDGYAVAEGVHLLEEARAAKREIVVVLAAESARLRFPDARVVSDK